MLECGCDPSLEDGYGDDGTHTRYSINWCPLHQAAERLRDVVQEILDAFDAGLLVRDESHDREHLWSLRALRAVAPLVRAAALLDEPGIRRLPVPASGDTAKVRGER